MRFRLMFFGKRTPYTKLCVSYRIRAGRAHCVVVPLLEVLVLFVLCVGSVRGYELGDLGSCLRSRAWVLIWKVGEVKGSLSWGRYNASLRDACNTAWHIASAQEMFRSHHLPTGSPAGELDGICMELNGIYMGICISRGMSRDRYKVAQILDIFLRRLQGSEAIARDMLNNQDMHDLLYAMCSVITAPSACHLAPGLPRP